MNHWNEEAGVFEFKALPTAEAARRSAATDSSDWVRRQLEWSQTAVADGQPTCMVAFSYGDQLIGKRHATATV